MGKLITAISSPVSDCFIDPRVGADDRGEMGGGANRGMTVASCFCWGCICDPFDFKSGETL